MKLLLLISFIFLFGWLGSSRKKPSGSTAAQSSMKKNDTINFATQIQPLLVKHCSPCHFTGGKMYERMPFDKDTTIVNHQAGLLRRIKGDDNALIKAFIEQKTKQ